jgi:phthiocerol/phenolphthiocerol synthesis type-I polyketide synthase E
MLDDVHRTLEAVPHYGIGHGLLKYVYVPTARQLAAERPPDIFFSYVGTIPELPSGEGPVQFDVDAAMPVRETLPALGHAIELRVYRTSGALHLDWWYDTRRIERTTVHAFAERFPDVLAELTTEAIAAAQAEDELGYSFTLVDLSSRDSA